MIVVGHDPVSRRPLVVGDEEHALVLGPPRSGKTTGKLVPSLLTHRGPALVVSSKPDVLDLTWRHRRRLGPVWVVAIGAAAPGSGEVRRTSHEVAWSPLPGCEDWEVALRTARAMTTAHESGGERDDRFWRSQGERLLAALLHAAAVSGGAMEDVARWALTGDLAEPARLLAGAGATWPRGVVEGLDRQDPRLRDSVVATAGDTLRVYDSEEVRRRADGPLLPVDDLVATGGTAYVVAPAEVQDLQASLVVGLLGDVRRAVYAGHAARGGRVPTTLLVLDEVDKIAPWPALPAVLGEGGSQGLQVLAGLQDLSQARARWGPAADGFATLFRHKVLLGGLADARTLRQLSAVLGEETVPGAAQTLTRPTWPVHRLAAPPAGTAVHIDGVRASYVRITRVHDVDVDGRADSSEGAP